MLREPNASELVTCSGFADKKGKEMSALGIIADGAVVIEQGKISRVGGTAEVMAELITSGKDLSGFETVDASGKAVLPGFVDSHTHLVFGGYRADEYAWRLQGDSYMDILQRGGGILSTVAAPRSASREELTESGLKRLDSMLSFGVTTDEGKSGYGLDRETEIKQLEVMADLLPGERIDDAQPGFDSRNNEPAVHINLDAVGARKFKEATRENVGKRMAIILFEKGRGEVVTAPVIREEIGGGRVQIRGRMNTVEANDTALLLRAGALAAPMEIIEERTVGPSLGADNIKRGFDSTKIGFIAIAIFMIVYYLMFGTVSVLALGANLLLLVALLSMMQATLTLPDEIRFWSFNEIQAAIGKQILSDNFEQEFMTYLGYLENNTVG